MLIAANPADERVTTAHRAKLAYIHHLFFCCTLTQPFRI